MNKIYYFFLSLLFLGNFQTAAAQCPVAGAGDLVITEFMADPIAPEGDREYIEIYNNTDVAIDMMGMMLKDDGSNNHTINATLTVPPKGYVIIAREDDQNLNGGIIADYVASSSFSLGNDDEIIIICNDVEIDKVKYTKTSFGIIEGTSNILDPTKLSDDNSSNLNWCLSTSTFGSDNTKGTPGAANDACLSCGISNVAVSNGMCSGADYTLEVSFTVADGSGNYQVIDTDNSNAVIGSGTVSPITVTLTGNTNTTAFNVNVWDMADNTCIGSTPVEVTPMDCTPMIICPSVGDLVITEFMSNPATVGDGDGEYFEIYNASASTIDLNGFEIRDEPVGMAGQSFIINTSLTVAAGAYVVLGENNDSGANGGVTVDFAYGAAGTFSLTNSADKIFIVCNDLVIDKVEYGITFPLSSGAAAALNPDNLNITDNDTGANWCLATSEIKAGGDLGTPGLANDVCAVPMCEITNVGTTNSRCNGADFLFDVTFAVSNGGGSYEVIDVTNGDAQLATGTTSPITVTIPNNISTTDFQITVRDVATTTCIGNNQTVTPLDCSVAITCPNEGDLVITEIMQNPSTVADNAGEYFEVYNTTANPIDLLQFILKDDGGSSHTIPTSVVVAASSYAVLGINSNMSTNGGVTVDYQYSNYTLTNADDQVVLECQNTIIHRVAYDGGTAFPDPDGASMQLASGSTTATDNNEGANWCVSTAEIMTGGDLGTPGAANGDCIVLAVELINFTGNQVKDAVLLKWQTASETNHDRYDIEYSVDGVTFAAIGQQKGQNIDNQSINYTFTHIDIVKGSNFYRLRAVDFAGEFTLSKVIQIEVNVENKITLFPNPTSDQLIISGNLGIDARYQIINQLGQVMQTEFIATDNQINIAALPAGVYYLKISTKNTSQLQCFVKK